MCEFFSCVTCIFSSICEQHEYHMNYFLQQKITVPPPPLTPSHPVPSWRQVRGRPTEYLWCVGFICLLAALVVRLGAWVSWVDVC